MLIFRMLIVVNDYEPLLLIAESEFMEVVYVLIIDRGNQWPFSRPIYRGSGIWWLTNQSEDQDIDGLDLWIPKFDKINIGLP